MWGRAPSPVRRPGNIGPQPSPGDPPQKILQLHSHSSNLTHFPGGKISMASPLTILGICGSLRKGSYNRMALVAAQKLVPQDAKIEIFDLHEIPIFNQDFESSPPAIVAEFKKRIRAADAILFMTPEYNFSIPGVLKNAIDWASRPYGDNAWNDKPAVVMSTAPGLFGGVRAHYHLLQVFVFLNIHPMNQPEVMISKANERFDAEGNLADETTKKLMTQALENLVAWTRRLGT
jgi:chromate reductase